MGRESIFTGEFMRFDCVVWLGCALLFAAGFVWAQLTPEAVSASKSELSWEGIFSVTSAIATAIAAGAACYAAFVAKQQSGQNSVQSRWQIYLMHYESFKGWIREVELDVGVHFSRPSQLYDSIFPNNRNVSLPFTAIGNDEVLAWHASYEKMVAPMCSPLEPSENALLNWFTGYVELKDYLLYSKFEPGKEQLVLGDTVPTEISIENYASIVPDMGEVLERLSDFCFIAGCPKFRGLTHQFNRCARSFINSAQSRYANEHQYRVYDPAKQRIWGDEGQDPAGP